MIFYFTGTGNCLAVARRLAEALDEPLRSIPQELKALCQAYPRYDAAGLVRPAELDERVYEDERIVFVVPVYGHELPSLVELFIERCSFKTPYLAFVLTYGNRTGDVVDFTERLCARAGVEPAYVETLLMVDNWLPDYDIDIQRSMDKGTDAALAAILGDLQRRRHYVKPVTERDRAAHRALLESGFRFRPWQIIDLLTVTDRCTSCGICVQTCPSGCIAMAGEAARRDALSGWGCSACLACINVCPSMAYECAFGEANPAVHYRNDAVSVADLMRANNQT